MSVDQKTVDIESLQGHTRGPWKVGRHLGSRTEVRLIHHDAGNRGGIEVIEGAISAADARLIAAAPVLLAEVIERRARDVEVAELIEAAQVFVTKYDAGKDGTLGVGLVNGDFFRLREVLSRITGE